MKLMNNIDKEEKKLIRKMFWRSGAMYASVNPVTMGGDYSTLVDHSFRLG